MGDFFDDDLVQRRDRTERLKMGIGDEPASDNLAGLPAQDKAARPVADISLTTMAKRKEIVENQVANTMQELERLRQRQETLEKEKRDLQEMRSNQDSFERGKRELIDRLHQSLLSLEKEEIRADRMVETVRSTRERFKAMLDEIKSVNEEEWRDDGFREQLNKALAMIDGARQEYNKSVARIETLSESKEPDAAQNPMIEPFHESVYQPQSFFYWLKVGCAVTLPLILAAFLVLLIIRLFPPMGAGI